MSGKRLRQFAVADRNGFIHVVMATEAGAALRKVRRPSRGYHWVTCGALMSDLEVLGWDGRAHFSAR